MMNNQKSLGLYVHIPFCVKKCNYCDFLSGPFSQEEQNDYINALIKEMRSLKEKYAVYEVDTVFIGGGTPSLLSVKHTKSLLDAVQENFQLGKNCEYTIECNPKTITDEKAEMYKNYGVNRISLGLQSVNENELRRLGRVHSYKEFLQSYDLLRNKGIMNISIDLMFGIPEQNIKSWENTFKSVLKLSPEHISGYSLIIEQGTNFFHTITSKDLPSEEEERQMYALLIENMEDAGYLQYEISNFAKQGKESRHNTKYWLREPYLGLGLGAASLIQNVRFRNTDNFKEYIKTSYNPDLIYREKEVLSLKDQMEEFIFLGLRMTQGISTDKYFSLFNIDFFDRYRDIIEKYVKMGLMTHDNKMVRLTKTGIDVSNIVFSAFMDT